jgi:hypothetical protein
MTALAGGDRSAFAQHSVSDIPQTMSNIPLSPVSSPDPPPPKA